MIEVELPGGAVVEFPDGTSPDVIKNALSSPQARSAMQQPQAQQTSQSPSGPQSLQNRAQNTFGFKDYAYRGQILPFGRTESGETELATPEVVKDMMTSALLPQHAVEGGSYTPQDVAKFTLDYAMPATQHSRVATGQKVVPTKKQIINEAKTGEQLRAQASKAYESARQAGVVVSDNSYDNFVNSAETTLRNEGFRDKLYPQIRNVLDSWRTDREPAIDFTELDIYRKQLTDLRRSQDKSAQRLGEILTDKLDEYVDNLSPSDLTAGSADEAASAAAALKEARLAYTRSKKVETIEDMMFNANRAASGFENGIVQEMRRITKRDSPSARKRIAAFSPDERKMMEDIAEQPTSQKILRLLGKMSAVRSDAGNLSGAMLGGGMGAYVGGQLAGPPGAMVGAMAAPTVGYGAQKMAMGRMNNQMDLLKAMAATGKSAGGMPAEQMLRYQMLARGVGPLAGAGALSGQGSPNEADAERKARSLERNRQWLSQGGV